MKFVLLLFLSLFVFNVDGRSMDQMIQNAMMTSEADAFVQPDGSRMIELDIMIPKFQWKKMEKMMKESTKTRYRRKAYKNIFSRWKKNTVPFKINDMSYFTNLEKSKLINALYDWQNYTCVKFQNVQNENVRSYIEFRNGAGCSSGIGEQGRRQFVNLAPGCRIKGIIAHEVGHALGLFHEQMRPDRDQYISIIKENILGNLESQFRKLTYKLVNTYEVPYDYKSIMHYGQTAFSKNGRRTIITKDPKYQNEIGNRMGVSFADMHIVNLMYKCSDHCPASVKNRKCPKDGFLSKDCKCWCPNDDFASPYKICSSSAQTTPSGSGKTKTTKKPCYNFHMQCNYWASNGECTNARYRRYMVAKCPKACGICGGTTTAASKSTTMTPCANLNNYCSYWQKKGYCSNYRYKYYMRKNCKKSCKIC